LGQAIKRPINIEFNQHLRAKLDGGAEGIRTHDPHNAIVVLYQLSYDPIQWRAIYVADAESQSVFPSSIALPSADVEIWCTDFMTIHFNAKDAFSRLPAFKTSFVSHSPIENH
jgi:hypothetical protein